MLHLLLVLDWTVALTNVAKDQPDNHVITSTAAYR